MDAHSRVSRQPRNGQAAEAQPADTATEVRGRLEAWLHGRTALVVGHHAGALPRADRILRITDGHFARA